MQYPEQLQKLLENETCQEDTTGLSEAKVLIYDHYVLKIQNLQERVVSIMKGLENQLPIPHVIYYSDPYLLMSKVEGVPSYELLDQMDLLLPRIAKILLDLQNADTTSLPLINMLEYKKKIAIENIQDELFGFESKEALIHYIESYQDELVLSHGDFCLPNIMIQESQYGLIDLDQLGLNSKWCDIALCLRSLQYNLEGRYGGKVYPSYNLDLLFSLLSIEWNQEQLRYHWILDALL